MESPFIEYRREIEQLTAERDALKDAANDMYERYHEFLKLTYDNTIEPGERVLIGFRFGEAMGKLMRLVNPLAPADESPDNQETA